MNISQNLKEKFKKNRKNPQNLNDFPHKISIRGWSGMAEMVPKTGLAVTLPAVLIYRDSKSRKCSKRNFKNISNLKTSQLIPINPL